MMYTVYVITVLRILVSNHRVFLKSYKTIILLLLVYHIHRYRVGYLSLMSMIIYDILDLSPYNIVGYLYSLYRVACESIQCLTLQ